MAKVQCAKCPELYIADLGVLFHKGVASVTSKNAIAAMKQMKEYDFVFVTSGKEAPQ